VLKNFTVPLLIIIFYKKAKIVLITE